MGWYLVSTTSPGLRFKIVSLDKATQRATLLGDTGAPFERDISEEVLTKYFYKIERIDDAPIPAGQAAPA